MESELRAGIDIGTNTILLLVARVHSGKSIQVLEDHVRVVRLGQGVDSTKRFAMEAMDRARKCFTDYRKVLDGYPGIKVNAIATSGSRDAKNSAEFFEEIFRKFGISVSVVSGEEEARLSFQGALAGTALVPEKVAVIDIGGGSTEVVAMNPATKELFKHSFDFGCVRMTERFLKSDPPTAEEIQNLRVFLKQELGYKEKFLLEFSGKELVGVAGTVNYLSSSQLGLDVFEPKKVQGTLLSLSSIQALLDKFCSLTANKRLGIGGMDAGRADVILAGAVILQECLIALKVEQVLVSVQGLRYGAVL